MCHGKRKPRKILKDKAIAPESVFHMLRVTKRTSLTQLREKQMEQIGRLREKKIGNDRKRQNYKVVKCCGAIEAQVELTEHPAADE